MVGQEQRNTEGRELDMKTKGLGVLWIVGLLFGLVAHGENFKAFILLVSTAEFCFRFPLSKVFKQKNKQKRLD